jgi:hypothetical protein
LSLNYLVNGSEMQHWAQVIQIMIIHTMVVIFHMRSFLYINTLILSKMQKVLLKNYVKILTFFLHDYFFHLRSQILSLVNREKNLNCQTKYFFNATHEWTPKLITLWALGVIVLTNEWQVGAYGVILGIWRHYGNIKQGIIRACLVWYFTITNENLLVDVSNLKL